MKVRKRRPARPGEEFLQALAAGRDESDSPPSPLEAASPDVNARLAESEREKFTAEEALRQLRAEADRRLEDAREAVGRERERRLELEQRLEREGPAGRVGDLEQLKAGEAEWRLGEARAALQRWVARHDAPVDDDELQRGLSLLGVQPARLVQAEPEPDAAEPEPVAAEPEPVAAEPEPDAPDAEAPQPEPEPVEPEPPASAGGAGVAWPTPWINGDDKNKSQSSSARSRRLFGRRPGA